MQRFYPDRDAHGPEFDNRLIQLVRANPAIYDVNHPNYRRNPVRVTIWDRIATELGAPSRFLQTKWKNIRYNYLQEIKCLETGQSNVNIRKRRFTEDLSFLKNTAQSYNVKKGVYNKNSSYNSSDNESNSFLYSDLQGPNAYEVIEIDNSEDGSNQDLSTPNKDVNNSVEEYDSISSIKEPQTRQQTPTEPQSEVFIQQKPTRKNFNPQTPPSPTQSLSSSRASPSPTRPLVVMSSVEDNQTNGESIPKNVHVSPSEIMANAAKRKAAPAPFPVLTPINDPIELYCLSLVDSLRSMSRSERERVKFEFAKILKDAKYKDQS